MIQYARHCLRSVRWPEIALGKLTLGFIALSMGVALGQLDMMEVSSLVVLFAALGVFGYGWNDWCDRTADRLSGRPNAFDRITPFWAGTILLASTSMALAMGSRLGANHTVLALTFAQLSISSLYSAQRVRLKEKGWLGIVSIIAAQYVLPGWIILATARHPCLADWIFLEGVALVDGLTLEIGHQLADRDNDIAAGVHTLAVSFHPQALQILYRRSAVVLGCLFAVCPIYLTLRFVSIGEPWPWVALMTPAVVASLLLAARTWAEMLHAGIRWDPYYGEAGPATVLLFSYFPSCFLPLWIAIAAFIRHQDAWALPLIALVLLWAVAVANVSVTTGAKHYGLEWHIRSVIAMFAGE